MLLRIGFAVLAASLVIGCQTAAPPEQQWTRSGATPEDVKRDLYWCTTVRERRSALQTPADPRRVSEIVDDDCMEKRGYSKKS